MIVTKFESDCTALFKLPSGNLRPQPFVEGSRLIFEKVAAAVKAKHGLDFPGVVLSWNSFLANAPQTDVAEDYVQVHPLYIPFKEKLFGISTSSTAYSNCCDHSALRKQQEVCDAEMPINNVTGKSYFLSCSVICQFI